MKKLQKLTLKDFDGKMQLMDLSDQKGLLGGTDVTRVNINGGYILSYDNAGSDNDYSIYFDNNGNQIVFDGITTDNGDLNGSAYQYNGIHVGSGPTLFFDIGTMIHEYGHYLQQKEWGSLVYGVVAGTSSGYGHITDSDDYYQIYSEQNASQRGQAYMNTYYPGIGYSAEGL